MDKLIEAFEALPHGTFLQHEFGTYTVIVPTSVIPVATADDPLEALEKAVKRLNKD